VEVRDIVLAIRTQLDSQIIDTLSGKSLVVERGKLSLNLTPAEPIHLSPEQVFVLTSLPFQCHIFIIKFPIYIYIKKILLIRN